MLLYFKPYNYYFVISNYIGFRLSKKPLCDLLNVVSSGYNKLRLLHGFNKFCLINQLSSGRTWLGTAPSTNWLIILLYHDILLKPPLVSNSISMIQKNVVASVHNELWRPMMRINVCSYYILAWLAAGGMAAAAATSLVPSDCCPSAKIPYTASIHRNYSSHENILFPAYSTIRSLAISVKIWSTPQGFCKKAHNFWHLRYCQ